MLSEFDKTVYIPIDALVYRNDSLRTFDVFWKAGDGKIALYCSKGENLSLDLKAKLELKYLTKKLYVRKQDKASYDHYIEMRLQEILGTENMSTEVKASAAFGTIKRIANELFANPKAGIIRRWKQSILNTMDFVLSDHNAFHRLMQMTMTDNTLYDHCVNVGILGMGLAAEMLKNDIEFDYDEAVPAFFLHDIGKCALPVEVLRKQKTFTSLDWTLMKRHPAEGCEILRKNGMLTEEAHIIVGQHHERHDGSGYPRGLKGSEIHLYATLCALADVFDGLTSQRPYHSEHSTFGALRIMQKEMRREFDPKLFAMFVSLFGE